MVHCDLAVIADYFDTEWDYAFSVWNNDSKSPSGPEKFSYWIYTDASRSVVVQLPDGKERYFFDKNAFATFICQVLDSYDNTDLPSRYYQRRAQEPKLSVAQLFGIF